jgi:hypothetical protein
MEKPQADPEEARYQAFKAATRERVSKIGFERRSMVQSAKSVTDRLFEATKGDPSQVTDPDIVKQFDRVDRNG